MDFKVSAEDYRRLQDKLKTIDKKTARAMRKRLRESAGAIGRYVLKYGVEEMPQRGGLQAYLMGRSPVRSTMHRTGVDVWLGARKKSQLSLLNRGFLRHPTFANELTQARSDWHWVTQPVPDGAFDRAIEHLPPEILRRLEGTITDLMKELQL